MITIFLLANLFTIYILLDNHLLMRRWKLWTRNSELEISTIYLVQHLNLGLRRKILTPQFFQELHFVVFYVFPLCQFSYTSLSSILSLCEYSNIDLFGHVILLLKKFQGSLILHETFQLLILTGKVLFLPSHFITYIFFITESHVNYPK